MEDPFEDYIKMVRKDLKDDSKTKQDQKISLEKGQELLIKLQRKKDCEAKAVKIVEFLIEGKLRPEVFLRCLKHINQSYYQDVVEERAIGNLCGYSLCDNQIPEMPKKQFYINTKINKVYDVTDRKNYCSNFCYKASIYIKQQVDDSPLWFRKFEDGRELSLLSATARGTPGEEISQGIAKPLDEPTFTSVSSFTEISLQDMCKEESVGKRDSHKYAKSGKKPEVMPRLNESEETVSDTDNHCKPNPPSISTKDSAVVVQPNSLKPVEKCKIKKPKSKTKDAPQLDVFESITKYLHEWVTLKTFIFLYGEAEVKDLLNEEQLKKFVVTPQLAESTVMMQKKYAEICRKLDLTQIADNKFDRSVISTKLKPVPDFKKLKEDSKEMNLKIRCFYGGLPFETNPDDKSKSNGTVRNEDKAEEPVEDTPAVLPLGDTNSQMAIRRKIFLNSVTRAVTNLALNLGISSHCVMEDIHLLVKTFKLEAHNVVFKPVIWSFIALVLINLLSIRDNNLKMQLETKQAVTFIDMMLSRFPNAQTSLSKLLAEFEDINLFLRKYFLENADC